MHEYHWYDFVGNVGVAMILVAYCMLQLNRIDNHSLTFSTMNFCGAFLILTSLYFDFNLSAFVIEFFWLLISLYGIWAWLKRHSNKNNVTRAQENTVS